MQQLNCFERIALCRQRRQLLLLIEEPELPILAPRIMPSGLPSSAVNQSSERDTLQGDCGGLAERGGGSDGSVLTATSARVHRPLVALIIIFSRPRLLTARCAAMQYRSFREVRTHPGKSPNEHPANTPKVHGEPNKNGGRCDESKCDR